MLKTSKCNILVDDGIDLTAYNVLSGQVSRFTGQARLDAKEAFGLHFNNSKCNEFLSDKGYLIQEEVDEDQYIETIKKNLFENPNTLF